MHGWCVRSFTEDEASLESVDGWDLRCEQVSAGVLAGESVDLQLPALQVLFERYRNVSTSHCGSAPGGALVFGIALDMAGDGRLNGCPWGEGVTAFDARQELLSFVPPVNLITLVVDRQRLQAHAGLVGQADLSDRLSGGPIVLNDAALARRLSAPLQALKQACLQGQLRTDGAALQQLADEILELLCPLVETRLRPMARPRRELGEVQVVRRARDIVAARADDPPRIAELCRELGVSRRWLQWSFNEVLGMGPWACLHLMRLNGARRMLLRARPGRKVADAIEAFGFWHLGRFSRDYRRHFGELPSQTLQRALARC